MAEPEKALEKERRDWVIILIILLIGFLCVIIAGGWAIRFAPTWKMDTNMRSNIDPNSDFLTNRPGDLIEPLDSAILTQPAWMNVFLTPGASFETSIPATSVPTNTPLATNTILPTIVNSPTAIVPNPTNTLLYFPPPTNTRKPPPPPSTNTPVPPLSADLSITKSDGVSVYSPGGSLTYTIVVSNTSGPDAVIGATVTDVFPAALTNITWTCAPTGSASCTINGTGNINDTVNLAVGSSITYTVNVNILGSATGDLINTAAVNMPAGVGDPAPGNNSSTDTDIAPSTTDLWIEITDNSTDYAANASKLLPNVSPYAYIITVHNAGPSNVTGAAVSNAFTNGNANSIGWTCNPSAGAICAAALGAGNLNNAVVNLNSGASVTFYLAAQVIASPSGPLVNTTNVTAPVGIIDSNTGNNTSTDTDILLVATSFPGNLGSGPTPTGPPYQGLGDGDMLTLVLPTPVVVGSHAGWDMIYYEESNGIGIEMDWVTLQIGDGSNWYTVLNWSDGNSDANTNIAIPLMGNSGGACTGEPDNCPIDGTLLVNSTGIAIDIDGIGIPTGTYPYLRIIASTGTGGGDGGVLIDGIYVIP